MAREAATEGVSLPVLLEYPELLQPLPLSGALPHDFEQPFPEVGIVRIRRGTLSATVVLGGSSRLLTLRHGGAVMEGLRFATSFFGKAQFIPDVVEKAGRTYHLRQRLEAPYYQPLPHTVTPRTWATTRPTRRQSEINHLEQSAEITEVAGGFRVRVRAHGTSGVPLAIEIGFREGGELSDGQRSEVGTGARGRDRPWVSACPCCSSTRSGCSRCPCASVRGARDRRLRAAFPGGRHRAIRRATPWCS
jgi:hypothetical protein